MNPFIDDVLALLLLFVAVVIIGLGIYAIGPDIAGALR
jgi:hypothetical protein